jgi:CubicO group peptidase (beta-lactamase class C family)
MEMESIDVALTEVIKRNNVPGFSFAIVRENGVGLIKGYGLADIVSQEQATPDTVYMWFSMTKIATATAIMQLADQGKLHLNDPVDTYVPNFPKSPNSKPATIRQLLNHSSGLANPIPIAWVHPAIDAGPEPDAFLNWLLAKHGKLKSNPGEKASYSNIGYVVLGAVVAKASDMPYKDYVKERILKPLGMNMTDFVYTPEMLRSAATGYQKRISMMSMLLPLMRVPKGVLGGRVDGYIAFNRFYLDGSSYGGLIGPIRDAARLVQAHLNHGSVDGKELLSPESVAEMQRVSARGTKLNVGLGWFQRRAAGPSPDYLEQLGGGAGFFNIMRIYPRESFGIVVMGNSTNYDIEYIISTARSVNGK